MALYRIPDIICFRCPLYGKTKQCKAAQRRAGMIKTHGVCPKIEYDLHQRRRILGDPQIATNKLLAKYRNKPAGLP